MPQPNRVPRLLRALRKEMALVRQEIVRSRQPRPPSVPLRLRERSVEHSVDYILGERRLDSAQVALNKPEAIAAALRATTIDGMVAEFGVYQGTSLTQIARFFDTRTVHGFDSFAGLPESWSGTSKGAGDFDIGGRPPELPVSNVEFHVGFFDTTVAPFEAAHEGPFSFVHLDADLYSSTRTVFDVLFDWFVPGTVIVFDEYFGYHGWQLHEHRAFMEFLDRSGLSYEGVSIGHMNLGVRLLPA
ncbi:class I SAM-dependent methyltransferase [Nocardioides sp. 1609]|uniref:class I SAM-dependent methyltransferase n=1 Tax=Nocardioides sp. 1609 TaxID=2508327 RepID=UPI0014317D56|nr:class I SAM-dependent methyltransferase [Nocardioides sp. 1609]